MYNMDITIPVINYKVSLEILILIGVVYLIMAVNTVCSCCNVKGIIEGVKNMTEEVVKNVKKKNETENSENDANSAEDTKPVEGFSGANTNYGQSSPYDMNSYQAINTSSWMQPNMTVIPGKPLDPAVQSILNRPEQPMPLPEGEMFMFANTPFKPECCPNTYSNSSGCACMTVGQYNGLVTRGGNNVPFSEY